MNITFFQLTTFCPGHSLLPYQQIPEPNMPHNVSFNTNGYPGPHSPFSPHHSGPPQSPLSLPSPGSSVSGHTGTVTPLPTLTRQLSIRAYRYSHPSHYPHQVALYPCIQVQSPLSLPSPGSVSGHTEQIHQGRGYTTYSQINNTARWKMCGPDASY